MKLILSDGELDCPLEIFQNFKVMATIIEDIPDTMYFPVSSVSVRTFKKIIEFARTGVITDAPVDLWCITDEQYDEIKELCLAADFIHYTELYDATCKLMAASFRWKPANEIDRILS